jgi:hypothetical protein
MRPFTAAAVALVAVIACVQLLRFLFGWDIMLNGHHLPVWISGIAFLVLGAIAGLAWREQREQRRIAP